MEVQNQPPSVQKAGSFRFCGFSTACKVRGKILLCSIVHKGHRVVAQGYHNQGCTVAQLNFIELKVKQNLKRRTRVNQV